MEFLPDHIDDYAVSHTANEPDYLYALRRETHQKILVPRMLSGPLQGRFLSLVSKMIKPKFILEIGTYTGYSALCFAEGMPKDGELHTLDINDELEEIQDKYFAQSGLGGKIKRHFGKALEIIPTLEKPWDLVFIDADKENYENYYDLLIGKMKSGSFIIVDNVLWSGKVTEETRAGDKETAALKSLNDKIQADSRVENVLLPLRDGLMMLVVK